METKESQLQTHEKRIIELGFEIFPHSDYNGDTFIQLTDDKEVYAWDLSDDSDFLVDDSRTIEERKDLFNSFEFVFFED